MAVNFDQQETTIDVNLPAHAFDYLKIDECRTVATDLLTKEKLAMVLRHDGSIRMNIGGNGARVWKIKL